jgi:hypothetical protein
MENPKLIGINELAQTLADEFPHINVQILNYDDMLRAVKAGHANWDLWAGSHTFQHIIRRFGSSEERERLVKMNVGFVREDFGAGTG